MGKKLDILVAKRVMDHGVIRLMDYRGSPNIVLHEVETFGDAQIMQVLNSYSTDREAAWQVVEEMREFGYFLTLSTLKDGVMVRFVRDEPYHEQSAKADWMSKAICIAALYAMGVDHAEIQASLEDE